MEEELIVGGNETTNNGFVSLHLPVPVLLAVAPALIFLVVFFLVHQVRLFHAHFLRKPVDLAERYGRGSWAVVLGGSQGIGLAFAQAFAEAGLNVVIMSRNLQNLELAKQNILAGAAPEKAKIISADDRAKDTAVSAVEVKTVALDFADCGTEEFWECKFLPPLRGLDISVLVANVGVNETERFCNIAPKKLIDMININCTSQNLCIRYLLPQLIERTRKKNNNADERKSAVITVSSMCSQRPLSFIAPYVASKAYSDMLSQSLHHELHEHSTMDPNDEPACFAGANVDVLSCRPAYVNSKMSQLDLNKWERHARFVLTPRQCVDGCLSKLGHVSATFGDLRHVLYAWAYLSFPAGIVRRLREARLKTKKAAVASTSA